MSSATLPAVANGPGVPTTMAARIDHEAVLKFLGLNPRDASSQALLLTCQRYELDPVLRHMVLIQGRPYVTRDGLLHVAHRSGQFDGIEVVDQGETPSHFTAKVSVYRKDMGRAFTYIGRYPKNGGNKNYGPEMAVKCGEVMALRRAFNVGLCAREEVWDQDQAHDFGEVVEAAPEPRREMNDTFPQRGQERPQGRSGAKPVPADEDQGPMPATRPADTWASFVAKACTERRDYWGAELAMAKVPQADRVRAENQLPDQHQTVNHFVTRAIETGAIKPEDVSKDGTPDGPRDPAKAKAAMADLYRRAPTRLAAAVAGYFAEKERELRVRLGMDDLPDDTTSQDGAEDASQEAVGATAGREPGCDDDR